MGIVNVTPDSFSDGGKFLSVDRAVEHGLQLARDGADILDIGGESTRPGSQPVSLDDEPSAALAAGAEIINDVTGLADPEIASVAQQTGAGVCAMHMQGTPQTMQNNPTYDNVVDDVLEFLRMRKSSLIAAGIDEAKICLDPGIGFGKTHQHNLDLLSHAERFLELNSPILIGHSRKGFIGKLLGDKTLDRDSGTLAISLLMATKGMHVLRVHEIANTRSALTVHRGIPSKETSS